MSNQTPRAPALNPYLRLSAGLTLLVIVLGAGNSGVAAAAAGPEVRNSGKSQATLAIAAKGKALLPIVIADKASDQTRAVAAELAEYLRRVTGATFEVRPGGDASAGIVLGTLTEFPNPKLDKPLEIRDRFDGREAYAIGTEPGRLLLIGATDLAVSHAAFRFLELVGCRWFFQAPEWEVAPSTPDLSFGINETDRPTILARRIWYGYGAFRDPGERGEPRSLVDYQSWARHNRMAGSFTVSAGHAWQAIIGQNAAVFEQHPEYLALVKGERKKPQLCVSNTAVRKLAVEFALQRLRERPEADMVSMETSDGHGHCECDACRAMGSVSDRAFGLANEVARAVEKEFPGKMVGMLAYSDHSEPPSFDLEPNVYVQLTVGFIVGRYTFDELKDLWPKKCRNLGFYEYFSVWPWDFDRLPGGRVADVARSQEQIRAYAARGASSLDAESSNSWGPHGRGYYIANRLMWNPDADVNALLSDFYDKAFGPAAAPMRRYYERLDPGNKPLMSRHLLGLAYRDVDEASRLAAGRPDVLARLAHIKHYLRFNHLGWLLDREPEKAKKKELTLALITLVYRTRYAYINHWAAIRHALAGKAATEFNEPSWAPTAKEAKPWTDAPPPTAQETEQAFQEGLAYFQPQPVDEVAFSADLVPMRFPDPPPAAKGAVKPPAGPVVSEQRYQGSVPYALYSIAGEPIEVEIESGTIAAYRNRADARYTLTTADGTTIGQGRLKHGVERHPLEFKVPGPGLYHFNFDDTKAGWRIRVAADRPCTISLRRDEGYRHAGSMQRMYFYVPNGSRKITYYWKGGPHKVVAPDGQPVQEVRTTGEFVSIAVPAGADGQVWSFTGLALGHLWFFNLPNQLAASPAALLVPREVAERDKLPRRGD